MATWDDVCAAALPLPGAWRNDMADWNAFQVGRKGFVHAWNGRVIMKLERHHQELLFEARPEIFTPYVAGALRWSWVEIGALDVDEVGALVREAWRQVVPKSVSRAYDAERSGGPRALAR